MCVSNFAKVSHLALLFGMVASHGPHGHPRITRSICPDSRRPTDLEEEFFFLTERAGDVIENKGPLWKTQGLSGNVVENKASYAQKAGMLLKRKEVDGRS